MIASPCACVCARCSSLVLAGLHLLLSVQSRASCPTSVFTVSSYASVNGCMSVCVCVAGLQSLLSVQSSYQLSKYSAAGLALTYQPATGPGLQVTLLCPCLLVLYSCDTAQHDMHIHTYIHRVRVTVWHDLSIQLAVVFLLAYSLTAGCHVCPVLSQSSGSPGWMTVS